MGEIFVANSDGVLRFFGKHWQRIGMPGSGAARSLALGADGRIYVGGYQNFGVLERGPEGRFKFVSLESAFFPDSVGAPLGEVWDTAAVADGVYFATSKLIFFVGYDGRRATINFPEACWRCSRRAVRRWWRCVIGACSISWRPVATVDSRPRPRARLIALRGPTNTGC